eukprot:Hpha_TRINITY_DN15342_c0_g1::TRINITY_DN15342_c0_g1_i1::g.90925::m.90925
MWYIIGKGDGLSSDDFDYYRIPSQSPDVPTGAKWGLAKAGVPPVPVLCRVVYNREKGRESVEGQKLIGGSLSRVTRSASRDATLKASPLPSLDPGTQQVVDVVLVFLLWRGLLCVGLCWTSHQLYQYAAMFVESLVPLFPVVPVAAPEAASASGAAASSTASATSA